MKKDIFKKVYLVKQIEEDCSYWDQFASLEDAVNEDNTEVWVAEPKLLGRFSRKTELVKIKQAKRGNKK